MTSREQSRGGSRRLIRWIFTRTMAVILGGSLGLAAFSSTRLPGPSASWQALMAGARPAPTAAAPQFSGDFALAAELDGPLVEVPPAVSNPTAEPTPPRPEPQFTAAPEAAFPPLVIPPDENLKPFNPPEPPAPPPPPEYNPLTGQNVAQVENLERRPLGIKITLFPREVRPQSGVNLADLVF